MAFSADIERRLFAASGGRCANPDCRTSLFPDDPEVVVAVGEMAHIIARSPAGPRGASELVERETYNNAVLLCPNCHTLIDKMKLENRYDAELLRGWKRDREREVEEAAGVPAYSDREDLITRIKSLLRDNKAIWVNIGPGGPEFEKSQSPAVGQWRRQLRGTVVPNNWEILALARRNQGLLSKDELAAIAEFRVHADALAYNATAKRSAEGAPRFPVAMSQLFE